MLQRLMQRHHVDETLQAGNGLQPVLQKHWHHDSVPVSYTHLTLPTKVYV